MQPADTAAPAPTRTEGLADQIRRDIAANVLSPGDRMVETSLAEAYGVSRTPVREVLRSLAQESLLEYAPHVGYRVVRLHLRDLDDLYTLRIAIEQQAVRRLAVGEGDRSVLPALLRAWSCPPDDGHTDVNLVFADEHFHETLAAAAGGAVLLDTLQNINRRIHALRMREFIDPERVGRTYDQHASIVRAVMDADVGLAVAMMASHVLEGQRYVRQSARVLGLVDEGRPDEEVGA